MEFSEDLTAFLQYHRDHRNGAGLQRLQSGLGYAETMFLEKVWWPLDPEFKNLHPEYQVKDFKDGWRYIDFAYIERHFRVAIEIDGYGVHQRDVTETEFSDERVRQNHLVIDGWIVLRFAFVDVRVRYRMCQQMVQQLLGSLTTAGTWFRGLSALEREVVRIGMRSEEPVTPHLVSDDLGISLWTARKVLHEMVDSGWFEGVGGKSRPRGFRLRPSSRPKVL